MDLLQDFKQNPYEFIETHTIKELIKVATYARDKYFNDTPVISDNEYDLIIDKIAFIDPNNKFFSQIGAPTIEKNKVTLPYFMGSMNKFKPTSETEMNNWKNKYKGPYYISDKLDGVSALLEYNKGKLKLYTRGDGTIGTDISPLLKYLNISIKTKLDYLAVRGELIMKKTNFEKYKDSMANARNMVAGIVNAKKLNKEKVQDIDFVAYEMIKPWMSVKDQYTTLQKYNFNVVYNQKITDINMTNLSNVLKIRKETSDYEIDGIIIIIENPPVRSSVGNPEYAFAFKETLDSNTVIVEVLDVEWNETKDGYLKPRLKLVPTKLSGVTITYVTAFNAKYINDNKIGIGSQIKLVRSGDVIPHIVEITKQTIAKLPTIDWKWSDSGVDIIVNTKSDSGIVSELVYFVKKLHIKYVDEGLIKKLVDNNISTQLDIINLKEKDLIGIEGFQKKLIDKILTEISNALNNMTLLDLIVASNIARGLGDKKLKKILSERNIIKEYYNKSININDVYDYVYNLYGFDEITTKLFVDNLPKFIELLKKLPTSIRTRLFVDNNNNTGDLFKNMKIVFSGFRNKEWEAIVEQNGGQIVSSVSSNTSLLVVKDINEDSSKITKAKTLKIPIIEMENFAKKYKLI